MGYLITFSCYGTRIHGDEKGTVDKSHNQYKGPTYSEDHARFQAERENLQAGEYTLDASRRLTVLKAIQEVCMYRAWILFAAHVRTGHVHALVEAEALPEKL